MQLGELPEVGLTWPDLAEQRVASAARRFRPLSVAAIRLTAAEAPGVLWASVHLGACLRAGDTRGIIGPGQALVILEDADRHGAVQALSRTRSELLAADPSVRFWCGISSFPHDALTGRELLEQSLCCLDRAREWPGGRIETAVDRPAAPHQT